MKLVHVKRAGSIQFYFGEDMPREPKYFNVSKIDLDDAVPIVKQASFFEVNDEGVDLFLRKCAENNPGCEVEVYTLEQVGQCPAAEFVAKKVSVDGILPV